MKAILNKNINNSTIIAPLDNTLEWNSIKWKNVENYVKKLQHRITIETTKGNNRKIRDLQRLLIKSLAAKLLATRKVAQENRGKRTSGIDGILWTTPKEKLEGALSLNSKQKPKPLKRVRIPKSNGKMRNLGIPTIYDRAHQALWNLALEPVAEAISDKQSFGFRKYRNAWDAYDQIRAVLGKKDSTQYVLDADIEGFFDNVSHEWLLNNIPMCKRTLKGWLKSGFLENNTFKTTKEGFPQGGIISPTLGNIVLSGMENFLKKEFKAGKSYIINKEGKKEKRRHNTGLNLVRYADDFIITGRSERQLMRVKKALEENFLLQRNLKLSKEKTKIVHISKGFDFLGFNFKKYNGTFLGTISKESEKKHRSEIRNTFKNAGNMRLEQLIIKLNQKISGWQNYYRIATNIHKVWGRQNNYIWKDTWHYISKRHRIKGGIWLKNKYYKKVNNNNWIFYCNNITLNKYNKIQEKNVKLSTTINIYDLKNEDKIKEFWQKKSKSKISKDKQKLMIRQNGICPQCSQIIYDLKDGSDIHHIVQRKNGGSDDLDNTVLLHEHCHYSKSNHS